MTQTGLYTFSRESPWSWRVINSRVRNTQHNVASVTEHLLGACGGHDARKGTHRLRASGVSRFEQSVTRDICMIWGHVTLPGVHLAITEVTAARSCDSPETRLETHDLAPCGDS